ncbi:serine protease inhibitor 42Dd-like [Drosophila innubila]|uniref:serine protease inhibitor 42Dd-like n=1 Tax=Drosophila innubila TaxID=198719 RepID=UPI00148BFD5A|nr:serine protease inhibitor 42Dd-like [Drosophila innubila]
MIKVGRSVFVLQALLIGVSLLEQVSPNVVLKTTLQSDQNNILISPFLMAEGLTQLFLGAEGQTAEELKFVIPFFNGNNNSDINEYIQEDRNQIRSKALKYGNSLFVAKDVDIFASYDEKIRQIFNTDVMKVNFGDSSKTVSEINDWVAKQTDYKIREIVQETSEDIKIMLVSAIYFKGFWQYPFEVSNTQKRVFYLPQENGKSEDTILVDTMAREGEYKYRFLKYLDADAIDLPYAESNISMVIIKPRKVNGIEKLMADLNNVSIHTLFEDRFLETVKLFLPKFKFEYSVNLKEMLQSIGIHELFQSANLKSMTDFGSPLYVSDVIQKGFISVDEEGTTASAVQEINIHARHAIDVFEVNHPFIFYIKDNKRIYFAGQVNNPL